MGVGVGARTGAELEPYFPIVLHAGYSKGGHLVQVENSGRIGTRFILDEFGKERFVLAWKYALEMRSILHDRMARQSGVMTGTIGIRDMRAFGFHMLARRNFSFFKRIVAMSADNYPESMAKIIFVHGPPRPGRSG